MNQKLRRSIIVVLGRKIDEVIHLGDNITITVVEIRGDRIRLGIEAPQSIPVHRAEVYHAIKRQEAESRKAGEAS